ncbi:HD domain-containing protein [Eubacterium sp. MSJ-13]|uniref:HD-GYP domain-containing protein n=1 Tax=Eubacterium sp. MSJ-13 TaxID=2841513 RepID=UPI001C121E43|nr:HD domain-containing phosphohydrolase [Eubacterium sp. MSJ-13]MBU5478612.1 HD domain-containing protein [Eubacterium sp. MSJ-13]
MAQMRIRLNRLKSGMIIKDNIYSKTGTFLIGSGTVVNQDIISLLTKHFIDFVTVEYNVVGESEQEVSKITPEQEKEFKKGFQIAEDTISKNLKEIVSNDKDVDVNELLDSLNEVVIKANSTVNLCVLLSKMKENAEGLYTHSVNTALWGQILAGWLGYREEMIERVAIAGILHDIGILKFSQNELNGFSFHKEIETATFSKHTMYGYELIKNKNLDQSIKQAVLTHHEHADGSGFPLGVDNRNINPIAKVVAIADIYDTMLMRENGYKKMSPFEVLIQLNETQSRNYDPGVLMTFTSRLAQTFIQCRVRLNNGQEGKIILFNKYNALRPLIQIGTGFVDLALRKDLYIVELLY